MKFPATRACRNWIVTAAGLMSLTSSSAEAHLVTTGLGPVYDGVVHLALSPADLALVVLLAMLAAMRGVRHGRWLLAVLPVVWIVSGLIGLMFQVPANQVFITGLSFLLAGAVVAADRDLPLSVVVALVATFGGLHGFLTGAALAKAVSATLELTGEWVTLTVVATMVAGLVATIKTFWVRVVVRVMGSWAVATGMLLIGWSLRVGN